MTGEAITLLLIKFGPIALEWIGELAANWKKEMTPEEVKIFATSKRQSLEAYLAAELARRNPTTV